jgi:hypothetical protein
MARSRFTPRFLKIALLVVVAIAAAWLYAATIRAADATPTFTKDVAPILQAKCETCHRPESMAPMSLQTYQDARPWARSIKARVTGRQMPPWHIDKNVGIQEFKNDRSLSDAEIDTIARWVDAGAPQGDPKDMPPPIAWPDAAVWNFAKVFGAPPDLIVRSPSFTMPAHAQDAWDKRSTACGDAMTEPRWVRAIEIRPATNKGRKIVHHALARLSQDDPVDDAAAANSDDDSGVSAGPGLFMEWAVGKQGEIMRPDTGKLLLPGCQFVWDIHYSAAGEEITNNVELGIYLYPKGQEPKFRQVLHLMGTGGIDIPPNTIKPTQGFFVMKQNGRVESFQPHMHLRGKAMMMEAILPSGQRQILSHVDNFNFNWHNSYYYADDAAPLLPKGTVLRITAWHDNTPANKSNPDPTQWVGSGDRTVDEMAHAWVNVTYMNDEDFKVEVEKRKAARAAKSTNTTPQQ